MKTLIKKHGLILVVVAFAFSALACERDENPPDTIVDNGSFNKLALQSSIDSFPKEPLSDAEMNSLILMREEEKLARDVYTTLYANGVQSHFTIFLLQSRLNMDVVDTFKKI
jgi:hypothetical protein